MKSFEKYDIPFVGLKLGLHIFSYQISGDLLASFEESPVKECDIAVQLEFLKRDNVFELGFNLSGTVDTACDRCNELLKLPIEDRYKVLIKIKALRDGKSISDDPDIIFIDRNKTHINIAELIYEFLILSMPIYKVHPEDINGKSTCNPIVMQWLNNDFEEDSSDDDNQEILDDPRWEALKKLKQKK